MGEKDIAEKILLAYNDVFSDIINVLLFGGQEIIRENDLEDQITGSAYKTDGKLHEIDRDVAKRWRSGLSLIHICKSVSGEFSVENSVRKGKAKLVVVSEEASENTKKKIRSLCEYYKVPLYVACSSAELGSACGKEFRMSVAVEDEGLAAAAIRVLE